MPVELARIPFLLLLGLILVLTTPAAHAQSPNPFYQVDNPEAIRKLQRDELFVDGPLATYKIRLPTGELLVFDSVDVSVNAGVRTIRGSMPGVLILLTTDSIRGFGYVLKSGKYYVIDTVNNEPLIVAAEDLPDPRIITKGWGNDFKINYDLILKQIQSAASVDATELSALALSVVDIAFFYDQALADTEGLQSPRTRAQAAVDFTNAAIAMHGVELELRLVYVGPLATPLTGDPGSIFFNDQDKWDTAANFGADLLHYIYNFGSETYCGLGQLPGRAAISAAECGNFTIAHELGHNMGLHHDRANASDIGLPYSGYNYGYICGDSGTIMAYWSPRVPHYSTPLLQNEGEDCGIDIGQPNAAYNGAVLEVTRESTAAFDPGQTSIGSVSITTVGPLQVDENTATPILVDVTRDGDLTQEASVEIGPIDLETLSGADYVDFVERLLFSAGEATKQISINVIDNGTYAPDPKSFEVVLRYPYKLDVTGNALTISIVNDDPNRGMAQFANQYAAIWESQGTLIVAVERVGPTDYPLTVDYYIDASTAQPGVDYVDTAGQITFEIGESAKSINIGIVNDDLFEGDSVNTFFVRLSGDNVNPDGNSFPVFVWNDDFYRGQARFGSDSFYVLENAGSVEIVVERINGDESTHSYCVQFDNAGTAVIGTDYADASICTFFSDGQSSASVVTNIFDNGDVDGEKYFDVTVTSSHETAAPTSTRVFIVDDDAPTPGGGSVAFGSINIEVDETASSIDIPVERAGGSAGVAVVQYSTVVGTARPDVDYGSVSGMLVWPNGDATDKIVQVPILDDIAVEEDEGFQVLLTNAGGASLGSSVANVTILSDDSYGTLTLDLDARSMPEAGYVDFFVQRVGGWVGKVGISYTTQSGAAISDVDFVANSGVLSWVDGDSSWRLIRIFGIDDDDFEPDEDFALGLWNATGGAEIGTASATVTLQSDDAPTMRTSIQPVPDTNMNGFPDIAVVVPGSTHVHIRDGSTGVLISDINYGTDPAFDMAVIPDLDASGNPEIAILQQQPSGQVRVQSRDSVTGNVTSNLWYGLQYQPVSMTLVPDYDSSGFPEIAVLGSQTGTDAVRVQVRDCDSGTFLDNVFLGTQSIARDLVSLTDTSGNSVPEMGILGVLKGNDQVRMQIWDADTAAFQTNVWFGKVYQPQRLITMPDINSNGSDEIVAVGVDPATQNIRVQVRDSDTMATLFNIWLGAVNEAVDIVLINDINSNGFADLAILLKTPGGTGRVRVQDGSTGAFIRNLFYTVVENPVGLAVLPDYSGNGFDELAVLGENTGVRHVQILDTSSGAQVKRIDFP